MICGLTPDLMKFNFDTFKRSLCARILVITMNKNMTMMMNHILLSVKWKA